MDQNETMSTTEAAKKLGVTACTVWRLYAAKRLRGFSKTGRPGSHLRLYVNSVDRLVQDRQAQSEQD